MAANILPKVSKVRCMSESIGMKRYKIEGGTLSEEWALALSQRKERGINENPVCEISVWHGGPSLGSWGGTVWPSAWPELFECHKGTAQSGPYILVTPKGLDLLDEATYSEE